MGLSSRWRTAGVILLAGLMYLLGNGRVALWDRDEPRYAQTSRQMLQSGDWVVPHLLDKVRTAKPIFIYWCEAGAMRLLGNTGEFAARLPSSIAMIATLTVLAVVIGRGIGSRRAFWTVFILSTSMLPIAAAKMCITDSVLLLWITIAQLCLYSIYQGRRELWITLVMWLAVGLAALTKGPVVLGVQATTALVLAILDVRDWRKLSAWREACRWWKRTHPLLGLPILAAVTGPWLWAIQHREPMFLRTAFLHEVWDRANSALEGHKGPPGYYLVTVWGTYFPWSVFLPLTAIVAWKNRKWPVVRFSIAAVIGPWVLMEIYQTKLAHYVLPAFPPLAFLTADALVRCFRRRYPDLHHPLAWKVMAGWGILMGVLGLAPWAAAWFFGPLPPLLIVTSVIASSGAIAYGWTVYTLFRRGRPQQAAAIMGLGSIAGILLVTTLYLPNAPFMRTPQRVAALLPYGPAIAAGDAVMIDFQEDSLYYYQGGTIRAADEDYWQKVPPERWAQWVVLTKDVWEGTGMSGKQRRKPLSDQVKSRLERVGDPVRGWSYADGGRIVEVWVMRRKDGAHAAPQSRISSRSSAH